MSARASFVTILPSAEVPGAAWDPDAFRGQGSRERLADHVSVRRPARGLPGTDVPFRALEYRDLPHGPYLTFALWPLRASDPRPGSSVLVGEHALLFGTLRAYLGNVVVTPPAAWLGLRSPLRFALRSEFLELEPGDGCRHFWAAYLRSEGFLAALPLGGGGTRPRLPAETLLDLPVRVPALERRRTLDRLLAASAEREWCTLAERAPLLRSLEPEDAASVPAPAPNRAT